MLLLPAKVVDLEPCLKKPVEDSACHPYNTRGSMSEVQSLSSFQSESCDDNGEPLSIAWLFPSYSMQFEYNKVIFPII